MSLVILIGMKVIIQRISCFYSEEKAGLARFFIWQIMNLKSEKL